MLGLTQQQLAELIGVTFQQAHKYERGLNRVTTGSLHRIAGALGVRAPKKTGEQRDYDRAVREKEQKRRDAGREAQRKAKEESERAKAAVWGD